LKQDLLKVLDRLRQNQPQAHNELMRLLYKPALKFLIKSGRLSIQDAEDIFQESVIKIISKFSTVKDDNKFNSWCWTIIRNEMNGFFRKNKNKEILFDSENINIADFQGAEDVLMKFDQEFSSADECVAAKLQIFKRDFPERYIVISLSMGGESIKDIAAKIGRTASATKEYLSQSRKKLMTYLKDCVELYNDEK